MTRASSAACRAAGATDPGRQRVVNEDRFHADAERGIFVVIDGVGGQAAGGRAADVALDAIRARLAPEDGRTADRIRAAIADANNEIHRQAASRAEWRGMACVVTVAVVAGSRLVVGHVGDTRLYKLRGAAFEKITSDHSPVGEREDAGEIEELDAMRHPRRNEVYRDVGSEVHGADDDGFVEIREITWEADAALLLCSDGLTDLVTSDAIRRIVAEKKGAPQRVAAALVHAANEAGGKDNVTVVYVEGPAFAGRENEASPGRPANRLALRLASAGLAAGIVAAGWHVSGYALPQALTVALRSAAADVIVGEGQSIAAALAEAAPGVTIAVEPGEYRERLTLRSGVRVVSRVPRAAVLRLPDTATDEDVAVTAVDVTNAELSGFTIVGDAATPLGTGVLVRAASVRLIDLDVSGAAQVAVDIGPGDGVVLAASEIHDNPGAALALRSQSTAQIRHNEFRSNASSEDAPAAMLIELGAQPLLRSNLFRDIDPHAFAMLDDAARAQLRSANAFPDAAPGPAPTAGRGRGR